MPHLTRFRTPLALLVGLAMIAAGANIGFAQERSADRPGRFSMSPVDGGFVRLDTETGAMSLCKPQQKDAVTASAWKCDAMADGAAAAQERIGKLDGENKDLRAEVKRMEDLVGLNGDKPKAGDQQAEQRPGGRSGGLNMPSEEDIDKAMSYMERLVRKFHDTMKRMEGSDARKGTPL
jgi:hypothetical protein